MKKIIIALMSLALSGCAFFHVHKMDIEQGNIYCDEMIHRLHPGLRAGDVLAIMGTPMLVNTFEDEHWLYVYTFKPGYGPGSEKIVDVYFRNGVLVSVHQSAYAPI